MIARVLEAALLQSQRAAAQLFLALVVTGVDLRPELLQGHHLRELVPAALVGT